MSPSQHEDDQQLAYGHVHDYNLDGQAQSQHNVLGETWSRLASLGQRLSKPKAAGGDEDNHDAGLAVSCGSLHSNRPPPLFHRLAFHIRTRTPSSCSCAFKSRLSLTR